MSNQINKIPPQVCQKCKFYLDYKMITKIHETCFKAFAIQDKMNIIRQQLTTDYGESATTDYDEGVKII